MEGLYNMKSSKHLWTFGLINVHKNGNYKGCCAMFTETILGDVDNVNWATYRDSKSSVTLSTPLIKPNFRVPLPHRRSLPKHSSLLNLCGYSSHKEKLGTPTKGTCSHSKLLPYLANGTAGYKTRAIILEKHCENWFLFLILNFLSIMLERPFSSRGHQHWKDAYSNSVFYFFGNVHIEYYRARDRSLKCFIYRIDKKLYEY